MKPSTSFGDPDGDSILLGNFGTDDPFPGPGESVSTSALRYAQNIPIGDATTGSDVFYPFCKNKRLAGRADQNDAKCPSTFKHTYNYSQTDRVDGGAVSTCAKITSVNPNLPAYARHCDVTNTAVSVRWDGLNGGVSTYPGSCGTGSGIGGYSAQCNSTAWIGNDDTSPHTDSGESKY